MARLMAPLSASAAVLSLLCRPFLLAAEEHLGDANAYTCLAPIMEGQAMEESFVWKALAQGFQDDELPTLTSAASDGAHGGTKGLRKQDQFVLKLLDSKVQAECASAKDWREPIRDAIEAAMSAAKGEHRRLKGFSLDPGHLKNLAKKGHAKSDWRHESIGGLVDKAVAKARAQEDAIEKALAPRKGSSASGAPVAHEGEECWVPCGNRSGNCSSGFCGGGVCCRRFHLHPECPLGLQGGCSDKYCCVARPQEAPAGAQKQPRCNAKPGSWCLASVAKSLDHRNLTSVERCALERTEYMCPPGFYCSGGRESPKACSRGQRCPLGSVEQQPCPAGVFCPISIWEEKCPYAHACPENSTHAVWCPEGSYCPDGVNLTCPAGYVCDRGSVAPQRCALLASCPEGSSSQGWGFLAKCSMAVVIPTWTIAMKTVPRWLHPQGGLSGAIPTLITIGVIVAAWVANLNLIYMTARQFDYSGGPSSAGRWRIERLFGAAPHSTALVFLTILYSLLVYGFFISFQMPSGTVRLALDTVMVILSCATFNVYLEDWHSAMFIFFLWAAFKVVWALITQTGPAELRVAALCAGLAALAGGFCLYDTPELAQLLALAVLAAGAKEVVCEAIPWSELYMRLRRVDPREKNPMTGGGGGGSASVELPVLGDRSRTSSGSADDSPGSSAAAAVIAAARASLDAHQSEQEAKKERTPSHGQSPARSSTWVPRYGGAGSSSDDDEDDDCYASGRGGKRQGGGISFELREVAYRLNNGRKLLQDITFSVPGGASVAIMGASGAGKTTLLSVLSGRCGDGRLLGELRINGARMLPWQMAALRPLIGYVPQDDVMHGCLTVRENVEFQAELRLRHAFRSHLPEEVSRLLRSRIDSTISGLGLAHVRERVVRDGLSGGQRKRVSIGMEIVSRPRVLLLDEPSSGLDSSTTHRLLEMVLHGASTELCTSFATIHQPRWKTLRLFDMLVLLAPGGYLIYAGPVASLKEYFRAVPSVDFPRDQNPADVIIDASTFDSARMMAVEGIWRNPPQCIRAVLIPTPEMEDEEAKETWQIEEFGKMLAALWRGFAAVQTEIGSAASAALGSSAAASGGEPGSSMEPPQRSGGGGAASGSGGGAGGDVELGDLGGSARPPARPTGEARELLRPNSPSARWLPWLRVMASRWAAREIRLRTAQASSSEEGLGLLTVEAGERAANIHWAQQVWVHLARGLLVTSRALWPTVACSVGLLVISVIAFGLAFPTMGFDHIFLRMGFLFLLMGLVTAIAAQRIFGDEEHAVAGREAAVCSLPQVIFSFIGKDIASLVDIGISAACFTLTYWPMIKSNTSCSDLFALSFSFMYGVYGMNYIGSILFDSNIAKLLAVITSFICFLNCGAKPAAHDIMKTTLGTLLLLASPQRWALAQLYYRHAVGQGSTHTQEHFLHNLGNFANHDFSIEALPQQCPDHTATVLERWRNQNSWACHSGQLLLLGLLYRFLAMMGLLLRSSAKASGGELSFGMSTGLRTRITRSLVVIFLVFFMLFQLLLLGHTY